MSALDVAGSDPEAASSTDVAGEASAVAAASSALDVAGSDPERPELLVKLCGMRTEADVAGAVAAGCDFVGFVVEVPGKRRSITTEQLAALAAKLPPAVHAVGVFVDAPVETVHRLLADGIIGAAQLHGSEDDAYIARLRQLLAGDGGADGEPEPNSGAAAQPAVPARPAPRGARIIQAFRIRGHDDIAAAAASTADLVLLDSGAGSGKPFDWRLLEGFPRPFLLAGGLDPGNLAQAAAQAHRAAGTNFVGVDMSSGIETEGVKDPLKMKAATAAAKGANR